MTNENALHSPDTIDRLCHPSSELSADARNLLCVMVSVGAIGAKHAVRQSVLSQCVHVNQREIQELNLELLEAGVVVCSSCGSPAGQYIAETLADVRPFEEQLKSRALRVFQHKSLLEQAVRIATDRVAAERNGQGTLFENKPRMRDAG